MSCCFTTDPDLDEGYGVGFNGVCVPRDHYNAELRDKKIPEKRFPKDQKVTFIHIL